MLGIDGDAPGIRRWGSTAEGDEVDTIDPDQIRTILAVAGHRSFSKAAAELGVQQSAISHQIRRIEVKLGCTLFVRDRGGVTLTTDGEAVAIYARAMTALTEDMRKLFRNGARAESIRIGLNDDFARTALPSALDKFSRQCPQFEIEISCGRGEDLFDELDAGRVDVVIARGDSAKPRGEALWTEGMTWVGRADYQALIADPVPLILPPAPSGLWFAVLSTLRDNRRTWRVPFKSWSLTNQEAALRAGLGVTAFPRNMELIGLTHLGEECGLPRLSDVTFVLDRRRGPCSEGVDAFCDVLRNAALFSSQAKNASGGPTVGAHAGVSSKGAVFGRAVS